MNIKTIIIAVVSFMIGYGFGLGTDWVWKLLKVFLETVFK